MNTSNFKVQLNRYITTVFNNEAEFISTFLDSSVTDIDECYMASSNTRLSVSYDNGWQRSNETCTINTDDVIDWCEEKLGDL